MQDNAMSQLERTRPHTPGQSPESSGCPLTDLE